MDTNQWQDLDKIMRYLYDNRQGVAWYTVYTTLEMDQLYAKSLYEIAEADGYVRVAHKGVKFDMPDPYYVKLTDLGLAFFARTNYVEEHNRRISPQFSNIINNTSINNHSNGIVVTGDNNNTTSLSSAKEEKGGVFKNQWLVTIIGGLLLAFIIYMIKTYFDIDL